MEEIKDLLIKKFEEMEKRILSVLDQLNDEQVNWRPNESSNSIANLIVHIRGNVNERISGEILGKKVSRERDKEFEEMNMSRQELVELTKESFNNITETLRKMTEEQWRQTQQVRGKDRTHLDMLLQCAAHFSEHMGQILYIGKILKNEDYITTSIPRNKK
jgi:uncharacterized damage-inducible protein DinB